MASPTRRKERRFRRSLPGSVLLLILFLTPQVRAGQDELRRLSDAGQVAIYGASGAALAIGQLAAGLRGRTSSMDAHTPNALDRWMRNLIHGSTDTVSNFLDNTFGAVITPAGAVIGIGIMDINRREFSRDVPFFLAGLVATKGITGLSKSAVARPRPYCLDGGCPPPDLKSDDPFHRRSFISGHTSGAFYAATFFNHRFLRYMRRNWTPGEYRTGRWISPLMSFGWASVVGFSRIHSDKHYFTDVLAGAAVGALIAELYYHLAYTSRDDPDPGAGVRARPVSFSMRFAF